MSSVPQSPAPVKPAVAWLRKPNPVTQTTGQVLINGFLHLWDELLGGEALDLVGYRLTAASSKQVDVLLAPHVAGGLVCDECRSPSCEHASSVRQLLDADALEQAPPRNPRPCAACVTPRVVDDLDAGLPF
jgi:hypothetical protein